ncbi:hypothetical protein BVC80_8357g1 [Macleaya cordata]|uniref:Uncharacterized protein n=1 Tax=Macleaya cordata TaxID=56857 RepID=A0A200QFM6_MACCD|nr:hypothetical protein BVC80_8357g1 [Macleaya cordata]
MTIEKEIVDVEASTDVAPKAGTKRKRKSKVENKLDEKEKGVGSVEAPNTNVAPKVRA